ncbi:MAG: phosphatidylglycerophosphatase A [Candidatus Babeliales bacterium]
MKNRSMRSLSTLGYVGYLPASGTMASIIAWPCAIFFRLIFPFKWYCIICIFLFVGSCIIVDKALPFFIRKDPSEIVLDEYVGSFVALIAVPYTFWAILLSFLFFRFFDIVKCFGIKACESLDGALGIMVDDVVAGLFASILIYSGVFFELL